MLNINLKLLLDFWTPALSTHQEEDSRLFLSLACLTLIFLASLWAIPLLKKTLDIASLFSLAPAAGLASIILIFFPAFLLSQWDGKPINYLVIPAGALFFGAALSLSSLVRSGQTVSGSSWALIALICFLLMFCILRLPFIKELALPPYSDSIEHYQIIRDLSHPELPPLAFYKIERLTSRYYHLGFHVLAASLATLTGSPIEQGMLVLGQILQVIIPLSLFFPIKAITKNNFAGLGAVLFAGLCWRMPSFASNWGKYPALASLSMLPLLPGFLYAAQESENHRQLKKLTLLAAAVGTATILAHTRSLILLVILLGSWWLSGRIARAQPLWKALGIATLFLLIFGLGHIINTNGILDYVFIPYLRDGYLPSILVILLLPFGLNKYPRLAACSLLFLLFILISSVLPLPAGLGRLGFQHLLDRPFAQMVLFLPLSVLGGTGFAGLHEGLTHFRGSTLILPLFTFGALVYSLAYYEIAPSSCCQLANLEDITAYRWIENYLPESAVILIASSQTPTRSYGVDGGAWITPLTGIQTVMRSNQTPFNTKAIFEELCLQGITHIYAGGNAARFHVEEIASTSWYAIRFNTPGAYLYELTPCP
ncbi:MAG: hypothetical protein HY864_05360 [Chloroflexi bacterium]|nr:hypothetical protein [Chloroflexota bacterium]